MNTITYLVIATIINGFTNIILAFLIKLVYHRTKELVYTTNQFSQV